MIHPMEASIELTIYSETIPFCTYYFFVYNSFKSIILTLSLKSLFVSNIVNSINKYIILYLTNVSKTLYYPKSYIKPLAHRRV